MWTRRKVIKSAFLTGLVCALGIRAGTGSAWAQATDDQVVYVVKRGDTLSHIARRYGVSVGAIRTLNGIQGDRILVGQQLRIPISPTSGGRRYIGEVVAVTSALRIPRNRWKYVVGHHSGIDRGNAAVYDRFHREQRRMVNGLAYHFVIGNGVDSRDGQVEIGQRWHDQIQGGHVRDHQVNMTGIGICMVGNYQERRPTARQLEAFRELVGYLMNGVTAPDCRFAVHREIDRNHTICPGRFFPTQAMHRAFS